MTAVLRAFILKRASWKLGREMIDTVPKLRIRSFDRITNDRHELDIRIDDLHCQGSLFSNIVFPSSVLWRFLDQKLIISRSWEARSVNFSMPVKCSDVAGFVGENDVVKDRFFVEKSRFIRPKSRCIKKSLGAVYKTVLTRWMTVQKRQRPSATLSEADTDYIWYTVPQCLSALEIALKRSHELACDINYPSNFHRTRMLQQLVVIIRFIPFVKFNSILFSEIKFSITRTRVYQYQENANLEPWLRKKIWINISFA